MQRTSRQRIIGWGLVGLQAVLLVALVALGSSDAWPTPGWLRSLSTELVAVGLVLPSGNPVTLVVGVATTAFFYAKSSWEEERLVEEYPDYDEYRASTPRFVPRLPH